VQSHIIKQVRERNEQFAKRQSNPEEDKKTFFELWKCEDWHKPVERASDLFMPKPQITLRTRHNRVIKQPQKQDMMYY